MIQFLPFLIQSGPDHSATIRSILDQFKTHQVVAIAERHRSKPVHELLQALIRDPRLPGAVQTIVVEFGNPIYQRTMDRYVEGEDVPRAEFVKTWQNTSQIIAWDSPVYERIFIAVREVNAKLPATKRIRVVLGDAPIDWSAVRIASDYEPFAARSPDQARVLEREVYAKGKKALFIIGGMHLLKQPTDPSQTLWTVRRPGVAQLMQRRHPGSMHVVWLHLGAKPRQARSMSGFVPARRLGKMSFGYLMPGEIYLLKVVNGKRVPVKLEQSGWRPVPQMVDSVVFLPGKDELVLPAKSIYDDPVYRVELERRAEIMTQVFGFDMSGSLREAFAGKG